MHFLKRLVEQSQHVVRLLRPQRQPCRRAASAHRHRVPSCRPQIETLEDRSVPSVYFVNNLSGDPNTPGSLPYDVAQADNSATPATITFSLGLSGIIPLSATLTLNNVNGQPISIDGSDGNITVNGQNPVEDFLIQNGQTATINALTITGGHSAAADGGGIYNKGSLTLSNSTVTGNSALSNRGGGIYSAGTLSMTKDTVTGNSAQLGAGIFCDTGTTTTLSNCTIANNTGTSSGGGIDSAGTLSMTNDTVTGNSAEFGAGIDCEAGGMKTLSNCTIANNTTNGGDGGGIFSVATLSMTNDTVTNNSAPIGGGIDCEPGGMTTLINCTIANNTATGGDGGGIWCKNAPLNLLNTIVSNPGSGAVTENDVYGTITNAQANLFSSSPVIAVGGDLGGNQFNTNPLLGPLQNNGGPTQTMALQAGSPALGKGVSSSSIGMVPTTDQIGNPRPANSPSIGACETQFTPSPSPSPSPSPTSSPGRSPSGPAFDTNRVAQDALLMAEGDLTNDAFFTYFGLLDYFNLLGTLRPADQAQAQTLCFQDFFNDCLSLSGA
jgi:predicted outer membrane repeat protein